MNNDTNIKSMPDINTNMSFDIDSQALISAISTAISNGFENLNSLQVDAVTQIETNKNNIETNTENIATNTQGITNLNNAMGDITYKKKDRLNYGTPKTLNVSNNFRGKLILIASNINGCGEYFLYSTSNGYTAIKAITEQTITDITTSNNAFTLEITLSGAQEILIIETYLGTFTIS